MDYTNLKSKFKSFIDESSSFCIVYHRDADGLSAATLFGKMLSALKKDLVEAKDFDYEEFNELFELKGADCIAVLDLSIDAFNKASKLLEKYERAIILDHHKLYKNLTGESIAFIKSQLVSNIEPSKYTASKLTFDFCSQIVNLSKYAWIASLGIIGDFAFEHWKSFVEKSAKLSGVSVKELEKIASIINATAIVKKRRFSELYNLFLFSDTPREILESEFSKYVKIVTKEKNFWLQKFEENASYFPEIELYLYEIKPRFRIKSEVIDALTRKYPNKTIVLLEENSHLLKFSARRQDFKVKMNEMLEEAIKGIPNANAGGHVPAAGGSIPLEYKEKFISQLLEYLKKLYTSL